MAKMMIWSILPRDMASTGLMGIRFISVSLRDGGVTGLTCRFSVDRFTPAPGCTMLASSRPTATDIAVVMR